MLFWPIQWPEPSSPTAGPHPPALAVRPSGARATMLDPVPAMARMPGPPWKAASRAISSSPERTRRLAGTRVAKVRAVHWRTMGMEMPARPMQVPVMSESKTPARVLTSERRSWRRVVARSSPTRRILMEPVRARARV